MSTKSSAEHLQRIWERFALQARQRGGLTVSKRAVSSLYLESSDPSLLSRWTNPGHHKNWRIPLGRIPDTCAKLGATTAELDALMLARLEELADDNPAQEVFTFGLWCEDYTRRASALPPDEARVLDAYREVAEGYILGLYSPGVEDDALKAAFSTVLQDAQRRYLDEQELSAAEAEGQDKLQVAEFARRRAEVVAGLRAAAQKESAAQRQKILRGGTTMARVVKNYLSELARKAKEKTQ